MKLLLDTHIWVWSVLEPARISRRVTSELEDPDNETWVSPISSWEILMLARKGRIKLAIEPAKWIEQSIRAAGFREAALNHEVALRSESVDLPHRDPADRFLAATARVYDLVLVTADDRLLQSRSFSSLPNR